ncbi:hypothetical protein MQX03_18005 [Chryseobacterium aahli]|uniref:hypothetical protein n=1 Tax=Chryseobacterium aahli TaxID=1278643 RepID=UPI001F6156E4|nr:hypothetical protein [Chryseobacterium aahli]MCI3939078.1 hypothetical protein [Chryseobacterium aahli]
MKKGGILLLLIFISSCNLLTAQTNDKNLNSQLQLMRKYFLEENYTKFSNFIHPEVSKIMGGKTKLIKATEDAINKMKKDGFTFIDLKVKNPSKFIRIGKETQFTITQEILMNTPKGKTLAEYTLIGISNDNQKNWKFIDTSGKTKETMRKYFPFLSKDLIIKPKTQKFIK